MGIVYACIAPHGSEVIPKLAGDKLEAFGETRKGMEELAGEMKHHDPHTIIIATPHNLRLDQTIGIVTTQYSAGNLRDKGKTVSVRFKCNRQLAQKIYQTAKNAGLPVVGVNYGTSEGPASCMPMDWGTLIPLWFFGASEKGKNKPRIVIVTPSREIPLAQLVEFGKIIADISEKSKRPVAFVASADQGHAHDKNGPYGFHPASAEYDQLVIKAVKENNLKQLLALDPKFVEDAKPDSLWQIAMLVGVLERVPMQARFISYQVPTYFGMLCADFKKVE
ncbi:MAG: extradiol ring-cleavage dioxygenase [Candidatus Bathyarchaeia archaeon]|jgi:aromatic ring-opening dioxygenase LigB subunit|nr:extradiol ring-cleavage dioxygenase [Candidatus Bathyarchaeota archaeon A05DMB-4]MDH7594834.1 extradiol ring-cleavage dioxygenase [Candidatus Bathyarchaeota archaeon]